MAGKIAYADIGPIFLAFLRFSVAGLVLLPALISYRLKAPLPLFPLAVIGLMGVTIFYALQNIGLYFTSAANTGLIQGSIPVFTLILSALLLGEKITWLRSFGVICSVAGVGALILAAGNSNEGSLPLLGNVLVLLSALAWAFYTVRSKPLLAKMPQQVVVAASMIFGLIFLVPFLIVEVNVMPYGPISTTTWIAITYLGLFASGLSFILWNYGLKNVAASEAGAYTNLAPVIGVISAALVLEESISMIQVGGGILVIAGVFMVSSKWVRKAAA